MKKRFKALTCSLAVASALVVHTSAFASDNGPQYGAGDWDWAGSRIFYGSHSDNPVNSSGGDFRVLAIDIPNFSSGTTYTLYEYDPDNADDNVGSFTFTGSKKDWILRGISNYVDGDNGKAEFYLKTSSDNDVSNFAFYD